VHLVELVERQDGTLRCPSGHHVRAWLVVDLQTGKVLGAGRVGLKHGPESATWLGPRLQLTPDVLIDRGNRRYALPVPAHPAAA
jgi:hypothetical protein